MRTPGFVPKKIKCHKCNFEFAPTPPIEHTVNKEETPRYKCPTCETVHMIKLKPGGGIRSYAKCFLKDCETCDKARVKFR